MGDLDAYQAPLPANLLRLQRRETHRIVLSVTKPIPIRIERPADAKADTATKAEHFPIHDLSVEGAGFNVSSETLFRTGDALTVAFPLSRTASIKCSASVRHVTHIGEAIAKKNYRVGIAFRKLPGKSQVAIQRFLTEIELQRRALLKE